MGPKGLIACRRWLMWCKLYVSALTKWRRARKTAEMGVTNDMNRCAAWGADVTADWFPNPLFLSFLKLQMRPVAFPSFCSFPQRRIQARENASIKPNEGFPLRLLIRGAGGGNNEAFTRKKKQKKGFPFLVKHESCKVNWAFNSSSPKVVCFCQHWYMQECTQASARLCSLILSPVQI